MIIIYIMRPDAMKVNLFSKISVRNFTMKILPPIRRHGFRDAKCACQSFHCGAHLTARRMKV
jgi:hypothetical protein